MNKWILTKKCKSIISLIAVFQAQVCLACFDERVEEAPTISHQAAISFPYQVGFLISETSEVGSCIFLNNTTALASMHLGMLHNKNEKQLVVATNEVKLPLDIQNQIDFFGVMKNIEKGTASSYDVHFLGKLEEIPVKKLDNLEELNLNTSSTQSQIEDSLSRQVESELKAKPEDFLSIQTMMVKGKKFKLIGSDLAVLKLKKPIENLKKTVDL